jgi:hypothetical protein
MTRLLFLGIAVGLLAGCGSAGKSPPPGAPKAVMTPTSQPAATQEVFDKVAPMPHEPR